MFNLRLTPLFKVSCDILRALNFGNNTQQRKMDCFVMEITSYMHALTKLFDKIENSTVNGTYDEDCKVTDMCKYCEHGRNYKQHPMNYHQV